MQLRIHNCWRELHSKARLLRDRAKLRRLRELRNRQNRPPKPGGRPRHHRYLCRGLPFRGWRLAWHRGSDPDGARRRRHPDDPSNVQRWPSRFSRLRDSRPLIRSNEWWGVTQVASHQRPRNDEPADSGGFLSRGSRVRILPGASLACSAGGSVRPGATGLLDPPHAERLQLASWRTCLESEKPRIAGLFLLEARPPTS